MHLSLLLFWTGGGDAIRNPFPEDPTCKDCVTKEIARELPIIRPRGFDPNLLMVCDDLLSPDDLYASQQAIMVRVEDALRRHRCRSFQVHQKPIRVENLYGSTHRMPLAHLRRHPVLGTFVETIMIKSDQLIEGAERCFVDWRILEKINRMFSKMLLNRLACSQIEQDYLRDRLGWKRKYGTEPFWRYPAMPHLGAWPYNPRDGESYNPRDGRSWPYNPSSKGGQSWPYTPSKSGQSWPYSPNRGGQSWPYNPDRPRSGQSWPYNPNRSGQSWPYSPRPGQSWPWHPRQVVRHTIIPVVPWNPHHPCYWRHLHRPWTHYTYDQYGRRIPIRWPQVAVGNPQHVGVTHRYGYPSLCRKCHRKSNNYTPLPQSTSKPPYKPPSPPAYTPASPAYTPRSPIKTPASPPMGTSWPYTPHPNVPVARTLHWDPVRGRHCHRPYYHPTPPINNGQSWPYQPLKQQPPTSTPSPASPSGQAWPYHNPPLATPSPPPAPAPSPRGQAWPYQPMRPSGQVWPYHPSSPYYAPPTALKWSPRHGRWCGCRRCKRRRPQPYTPKAGQSWPYSPMPRTTPPPPTSATPKPPASYSPPPPPSPPPRTPVPAPVPAPVPPYPANPPRPNYTPGAAPVQPAQQPRVVREAIANGPGNCLDDA